MAHYLISIISQNLVRLVAIYDELDRTALISYLLDTYCT